MGWYTSSRRGDYQEERARAISRESPSPEVTPSPPLPRDSRAIHHRIREWNFCTRAIQERGSRFWRFSSERVRTSVVLHRPLYFAVSLDQQTSRARNPGILDLNHYGMLSKDGSSGRQETTEPALMPPYHANSLSEITATTEEQLITNTTDRKRKRV